MAPRHTMTLRAGNPAYGGYTIGRMPRGDEGAATKIVLIKGAIPDELVEVSIDEEKRDYYVASVRRVIEPSPFRVRPKLKGPCIGCQLEYISYDRQVTLKEEVLADSLRRIGGLDIGPSDSLALKDAAWNYRYRAQFKVRGGAIGFFREGTNEIVDVEYSPLVIEPINAGLKQLREALARHRKAFRSVTEVHLSYGDGLFAFIKTEPKADESPKHWDSLAYTILGYELKGVWIQVGAGKERRLLKYGEELLVLDLDDIRYTVSPNGFFQGNWRLNRVLVGFIKERLRPLTGKRVLDLFSGAGNFSLPLAEEALQVVAVEENPFAIEDGERNLQVNKITNTEFVRSASESFDFDGYGRFDVALLDPPRAGLSGALVERLLAARPDRLVYVSCNPSTFARDLKKLAAGYAVESVRLVDFFPQTYHIEALAFLHR